MLELEQLIAQWRRGLAETTGCSSEVLDELESHLREAIGQLVQGGHSEEQALTLAASRLGSPPALAAEFAKVAAPVPWLPVRLVTFTAIVLAALLAGYLLARCQDGRLEFLLAAHVGAVTLGYTGSFLVGFLAICYVARRPFRDLSPGQMQSLHRAVFRLTTVATALTIVAVLLGCVWAKDHLGRYWGWDPKETGAACVLAWNLTMLLLWWGVPALGRMVILLGIIGNIVVSLAWFAGAPPHIFAGVLVFGFTQMVLFGMGFLPAGRYRRAA
ncbi:MAG TPA: cytochrome c biogenesis protein CcsA [Gemmataceae bacterium]|jgi:hypothetical protein